MSQRSYENYVSAYGPEGYEFMGDNESSNDDTIPSELDVNEDDEDEISEDEVNALTDNHIDEDSPKENEDDE